MDQINVLTYVNALITACVRCIKEVICRIGQANASLYKLNIILSNISVWTEMGKYVFGDVLSQSCCVEVSCGLSCSRLARHYLETADISFYRYVMGR